MREIKFRAWDKKAKKFIENNNDFDGNKDWNTGEFAITPTGKFRFYESTDGGMDVRDKNVVLLQYTGLKDKNGVEIYEGDVVEERGEYVSPTDGHSSPFSRRFEVEYQGCSYHLFTDQVNGEVEVIGNIYENPELLKKKRGGR